ncbi:MAG: cytochrome D ubiquinol oxidase subunit II [Epsilonproteobacteria bacterium (ex Lamellibrachia satsuma)]|nr:MAG: cytochrome D ubiquinol oxidase subunit II [Epsilonproteobacteria bacterium (ex Lamellibrachia satsuma)]
MKKELKKKTETLKQIKNIIHHPNFEVAEDDKNFLCSDEARGVRLQLDYLKAEVKMQKQGIHHTIVVFGSSRIPEFDKAMEELEKTKKALSRAPHSEKLISALKKADSMVSKSVYYDEARKFGQLIGKSGKGPDDCYVTLMTGGGPGIMEAANRGAWDVGAKSIGLNIDLSHEQFPNPYITPELCFQFRYFAIRKLHFLQRAKALVIFPGGFGTLDEFFEILTLIQTKKTPKIPIVLIGEEYWKHVIDFEFLKEEDVIAPEDESILTYADSADDAWKKIIHWHKGNKTPLF